MNKRKKGNWLFMLTQASGRQHWLLIQISFCVEKPFNKGTSSGRMYDYEGKIVGIREKKENSASTRHLTGTTTCWRGCQLRSGQRHLGCRATQLHRQCTAQPRRQRRRSKPQP